MATRLQNHLPSSVGASLNRQAGFSLLELMMVVVVIGVLASIAYANYSQYIVKSRRSAAAACLMERAQLMERYYTRQLTYVGAPAPGACEGLANFYTVSFNGAPAAKTFVLQAVPTSRQSDAKCGTLSVDQKGARGVSGTDPATSCW
ncbi:type IV pilus assembly protein PilE [Xanthomonas arboricola]|uniref:type IV pilin protein n=1 Tax=Xanthomonas campestris TaxID=339 RepID=UPI0023E92571|nr:type IV pilus assembly protein PilE [Xanthomonas campestris]